MLVAAVAIGAVWACFLATSYLLRGSSTVMACATLAGLYGAATVAALVWLGTGQAGLLGCLGMLVPLAASLVVTLAGRRRAPSQP